MNQGIKHVLRECIIKNKCRYSGTCSMCPITKAHPQLCSRSQHVPKEYANELCKLLYPLVKVININAIIEICKNPKYNINL